MAVGGGRGRVLVLGWWQRHPAAVLRSTAAFGAPPGRALPGGGFVLVLSRPTKGIVLPSSAAGPQHRALCCAVLVPWVPTPTPPLLLLPHRRERADKGRHWKAAGNELNEAEHCWGHRAAPTHRGLLELGGAGGSRTRTQGSVCVCAELPAAEAGIPEAAKASCAATAPNGACARLGGPRAVIPSAPAPSGSEF